MHDQSNLNSRLEGSRSVSTCSERPENINPLHAGDAGLRINPDPFQGILSEI
jgi:hypothetical protein